MSLARLQDVTMSFSGVPVFSGLDFRVEKGEKIGLIGRNGTGKSTLFRLISRRIPPESGLVEHMKRVRIAYLAQLPEVPLETGIFELVRSHFPEVVEQQETLTKLEERIAGGDEGALEEYGTLQEAFHLSGGYDFESTIKRVLCGLGFRESEFDLRYGSLSGGQRTRLLLALLLLEEADLLLLDEPENHLDLQAREWLESFLRDWPNAFVIISHDRRMLNEVTTRTVELDRGKLRGFSGNYDAYLREKGRVDADQEKQYARQQEHIAKEQKWIDRFRYKNTKSRQVQSRIKRLKKLERIEAVDGDASTVKLAMGEVVRSGQIVLKGEGLSMAYDDLALYHDVTLQVERGERVGIIGPNGSGKTTFLRQLAGRLSGGRGSVSLGHKTKLGYFDQQLDTINDSNDVLSEIGLTVPDWTPQRIRSFMGRFLFVGEDVFKSIGTLSGGERSRVALAKLVLSGANLLLLDEPTNHLDIASREALETSLAEFPGTIVLVSHDRELIDRLVDKLVIIEGGRGMVHLGNYAHYRWKTGTQGPGEAGDAMRIRKKKVRSVTSGQAREKARRKDRKRFGELETAIEEAEAQIEQCEEGFTQMDPADYESLAAARGEYEAFKGALSTLYEEWDALSSRLSESGSEAPAVEPEGKNVS